MNPQEFVYWLQGYFELSDPKTGMTPEQMDVVRRHLDLVFINVTKEFVPTKRPITPFDGQKYC